MVTKKNKKKEKKNTNQLYIYYVEDNAHIPHYQSFHTI